MSNTLELTDRESRDAHAPDLIQLEPDPVMGTEVGGYLVETLLGEGGMGLVYKARHPILNRYFAIKVLRPEAAADVRLSSNFEREAQTLSSLKHPHIIDIVGFGSLPDGRQFMVMEFVKGHTLLEEIDKGGAIELQRALMLADQILDGLGAAHSVGVIHRDVKPGNVLIARMSGGAEVLKLLDFGLAKQRPEVLLDGGVGVAASVIAGTPEYIAPEQAQGHAPGSHSDLYSFGVLFFEMLTGVQPFIPSSSEPDRVRALMKMHLFRTAPRIRAFTAFPAELDDLVADLLNKDPDLRPSSAATVRSRLHNVQRLMRQDATHVGAMPKPIDKTEPHLRAVPAKSRAGLIATGVAIVAVGATWWLWPGVVVVEPIEVPSPVEVAAPVLPASLPIEIVPVPVAVEADDLVALKAHARVPTLRPAPCSPDDAWKRRMRADLNELVTRASKLGDEVSLWAAYREGPLSTAIEAATSQSECSAVNLQMAELNLKVRNR